MFELSNLLPLGVGIGQARPGFKRLELSLP